jgi:hypothetical protein
MSYIIFYVSYVLLYSLNVRICIIGFSDFLRGFRKVDVLGLMYTDVAAIIPSAKALRLYTRRNSSNFCHFGDD